MGLLTNRKIRTKILLAVMPLTVMVLVATIYSSYETKAIDTWYGNLIQHDAKTLQSVTIVRAHTMRYGLYLYEEITEPDADKRQSIDVELDKVWRDYRARIAESLQQSPERTKEIQAASALFDKAVADARPVRAAALAGDTDKAMGWYMVWSQPILREPEKRRSTWWTNCGKRLTSNRPSCCGGLSTLLQLHGLSSCSALRHR